MKKNEIAEIISPLHNGCSGTAGLIMDSMGYWSKRQEKAKEQEKENFLVITGFYGMQTQ